MKMPVAVSRPELYLEELADLSVSLGGLREAAYFAYAQKEKVPFTCPQTAAGSIFWFMGTHALREGLRPDGWLTLADRGSEGVINDTGDKCILFLAGDNAVGIASSTPKTYRNKGPNTIQAVLENAQLNLFENAADTQYACYRETWIYLVYVDSAKGEIRSEISLPSEINPKGVILSWSKRIILPVINLNKVSDDAFVDDSIDVGFDISKKR